MDTLQPSLPFYEQVLEFLAHGPTPKEIIDYKLSPEAQARLSELIEANRQRDLTLYEEEELDHFVAMDRMLSLLKVKAYTMQDASEE